MLQINRVTKQIDDTGSHTGQPNWEDSDVKTLNSLIAAGDNYERFDAAWVQEQVKIWTDGVTGLVLRQNDQTRSIISTTQSTITEGLANGDLAGSTMIQLRDANGVIRSGTVTQLRGVCYRYLKSWLANYISKAP